MTKQLLTTLLLASLSTTVKAEPTFQEIGDELMSLISQWKCTPWYWVNLRENGPDINPGDEPEFKLVIDGPKMKMSVSGTGSWLDRSEFEQLKLKVIADHYAEINGMSDWDSQFVFASFGNGLYKFSHSSSYPSVVVSMKGRCEPNYGD